MVGRRVGRLNNGDLCIPQAHFSADLYARRWITVAIKERSRLAQGNFRALRFIDYWHVAKRCAAADIACDTAGSHITNNSVDLRHMRDNLGHESISTTIHYLHADDYARHRETEERHKIGW